jgi:hypothetical protein
MIHISFPSRRFNATAIPTSLKGSKERKKKKMPAKGRTLGVMSTPHK